MVLKGGKATQKASISINRAKQKLCTQIWVQSLALGGLARHETLGEAA